MATVTITFTDTKSGDVDIRIGGDKKIPAANLRTNAQKAAARAFDAIRPPKGKKGLTCTGREN